MTDRRAGEVSALARELTEMKRELAELRAENALLREASASFGDLAERCNQRARELAKGVGVIKIASNSLQRMRPYSASAGSITRARSKK
jgi:hypothetical protein